MPTQYTIFGTAIDKPGWKVASFEDPIPDDELHNGVQTIELHASGDAPALPYVVVIGVDRNACSIAYRNVFTNLPLDAWWKI